MRWKFPNLHHQFLLFAQFGETCLDGSPWRQFLEELATRKGLDMKEVVDRLEMCGKPGLNKVTKYTANQMFDPEEF